jgi:hypothetical protein
MFKDFPRQTELVAGGLERLGKFSREEPHIVSGGSLRHTIANRVVQRACARVASAGEHKHFDPQFVQSCGLSVDLVGHNTMRPRAVDQDIDRRSATIGWHQNIGFLLEINKIDTSTFSASRRGWETSLS